MKALTVYQPWASLIVHGKKRIENRVWKPFRNLIGKRIAIHAGKTWDEAFPSADYLDELEGIHADYRVAGIEAFPFGAILGTALVVGWADSVAKVPMDQHRWFCGPIGWILGDVKALPAPIRCRGSQGLWDVPQDVLAEIERQAVA